MAADRRHSNWFWPSFGAGRLSPPPAPLGSLRTPPVGGLGKRRRHAVLRRGARFAGAAFLPAGAGCADGCRLRACLAAATLASRAAIMSTTCGASPAGAGSSNSSPCGLLVDQVEDLHPVVVVVLGRVERRRSATRRASRPSSPHGRTRRPSSSPASSSTSATGTTSSAYTSVDITSRPSSARTRGRRTGGRASRTGRSPTLPVLLQRP